MSKKDKVDAIVVLDPHALEELGEQSDEDSYQGADIYGIGSSVKAVVLLDNGNIQGLVVPDAYEIGYKSVGEMARKMEHRFYRLKGHKTEIKVFDRDEFSLMIIWKGSYILMSKKDRKRRSMIAVILLIAFLIAGCEDKSVKTDHIIRIGVVTYTQDDPFINAMTDQLKENLKKWKQII